MQMGFEVGEHYRNRRGSYEVKSIDGRQMVIRYEDGTLCSTNVVLQGRIWQNVQLEEKIRRQEKEKPPRRPGAGRRIGADASFDGFQDSDFQRGVAGTTWRNRQSLGGVLARRLTQHTSRNFLSWAVPRWPWVHIARPEHYRRKVAGAHADIRFEVRLDESQARFGLHIERGSATHMEGPVKWDWVLFLPVLSQNEAVQQAFRKAMTEGGIVLDVGRESDSGMLESQVLLHEGELVWAESDERIPVTWPDVAARLEAIDPDTWVGIAMGKQRPQDEVIERGAAIVDDITAVFLGLLPVYTAVTGLK